MTTVTIVLKGMKDFLAFLMKFKIFFWEFYDSTPTDDHSLDPLFEKVEIQGHIINFSQIIPVYLK